MAVDQHDAVTLSFEGPRPQRRATVAFRLILAVPHFFWMTLVGIATVGAIFVGWFAALVTGRMPMGLASFIARAQQYATRVYSYFYLLTDKYPGFSLGSEGYPVELELDEPPRLNRAAVLFRAIIQIPAIIASQIVASGLNIAMVVFWLITLIKGEMPESIFAAETAVVRYQTRMWAYVGMLTSDYPRGLFGDKEPTESGIDADAPSAEPTELPAEPRLTRIVLGKAARRLVVLFIVLGVVSGGGSTVRAIRSASNGTPGKLRTEHAQLETAVQAFLGDAQSCAVSAGAGGPECLHSAIGRLVTSFEKFQTDLRAISFSSNAESNARVVDDDLTGVISVLRQMQSTSNPAQYQSFATQFQDIANRFDADYQTLYSSAVFG